jgi:hypothetical protein
MQDLEAGTGYGLKGRKDNSQRDPKCKEIQKKDSLGCFGRNQR